MLLNVQLDILRFINGIDPVKKAVERDNSKIPNPPVTKDKGTSGG